MFLLRLTQHTESTHHYHVELSLEGDGARQIANPRFEFKLDEQDNDDVRWYMEDFLQYPLDPAPTIATRIEQRMADIGTQLFKAVFQSDDDGRDLWATLRSKLNETRIEVITEVKEATSIPWELLRDPKTDVPLALRAQSFVRAQPNPAQRPFLPSPVATGEGPGMGVIRILLVICRPGGRADVPFRSVASRIIKGLSDDARARFQLDVLRPPTFEQLWARSCAPRRLRASPITLSTLTGTACTPNCNPTAYLSTACSSAITAPANTAISPSRMPRCPTTSN